MKKYLLAMTLAIVLLLAYFIFSAGPARALLNVEIYVDDGHEPVPGAEIFLAPSSGYGMVIPDRLIMRYPIVHGFTDPMGRFIGSFPDINIADYSCEGFGVSVILLVVKEGFYNYRINEIAYAWPGESLTYAGWQVVLMPYYGRGVHLTKSDRLSPVRLGGK